MREYIARVVNRRDISAVDDLVHADYVGTGDGWPTDLTALRQFYVDQYRDRPDWWIDVLETVEVGPSVVVRAAAGGTVLSDGLPSMRRVEWLARYRWVDGRIGQIDLLELRTVD